MAKDQIESGCFCNSLYNLSKNWGYSSDVYPNGSCTTACAVLKMVQASHRNSLLSGSVLPIYNNLLFLNYKQASCGVLPK
jgi:hypothetical protein